jgi:hypothetical protein
MCLTILAELSIKLPLDSPPPPPHTHTHTSLDTSVAAETKAAAESAARETADKEFAAKEQQYMEMLAALDERQKAWDLELTACKEECVDRLANNSDQHREETYKLRAQLADKERREKELGRALALIREQYAERDQQRDVAMADASRENNVLAVTLAERDR